jgi:hypothetical protein
MLTTNPTDVPSTEYQLLEPPPVVTPTPVKVTYSLKPRVKSDRPPGPIRKFFRFGIACIIRVWQFACLILLLSIAASIPIVQLASFGYILEATGRWARGEKLRRCLPGLKVAGYIGTAAVWIGLTSIPVFIVRDLAASARLIDPGSGTALGWQITATFMWVVWVVYVWWAVLRGGRIYHFIWPAPIRFIKDFFRPSTWNTAVDRMASGIAGFKIISLMKLGFFGSLGALLYLAIPGLLMIAGTRAGNDGARGILTICGVVAMAVVLQYVPFAQMRYAKTKQFRSFFRIGEVREGFKRAPWLHAIATVLLVAFSLPLYLLRIEPPPAQLIWLLCVFFVLFNLPAKFIVAWAIRYSEQRQSRRAWYSRWPAWLLLVASLPIYVFFLYLASFTNWDGSAVMIMQHAFLTPVPFWVR